VHCCCFCCSSDGDYAGFATFTVGTGHMYNAHVNCLRSGVEFALGSRSTVPAELLRYVEQTGLEGNTTMLSPSIAHQLQQHHAAEILALWRRSRFLQCSYCSKQHATLSCAVKGCSCSSHLPCIPAASNLIAVPLMAVRLRPSWLWLCPAHTRGDRDSELFYTEALPRPRAGKVCCSIEDVPEKQCEALVELGISLPVGLAATAEESHHEQTAIFADDSSVVVARDTLLLPLQLPTFLPNDLPQDVQQQQQQQAAAVAPPKQQHVEQTAKQQQRHKPSKQKAAAAAAEQRASVQPGRPGVEQGNKRNQS
jgi:hypothetical protein